MSRAPITLAMMMAVAAFSAAFAHAQTGPSDTAELTLAPIGAARSLDGTTKAPTKLTMVDRGASQVLRARVSGLTADTSYVLGVTTRRKGRNAVVPLVTFTTDKLGSAVVDAVGAFRKIIRGTGDSDDERYLVIAPGTADKIGEPVQTQVQ